MHLKTLAISVASAIAHDFDNVFDVWEIKKEDSQKITPIDSPEKLDQLSKHFKPSL